MPIVLVAVILTGVVVARSIHSERWRGNRWDTRAQLSLGWTIIVLGLVHIAATWLLYSELSNRALWFASGGIAMALGGAVNLLQRVYVASAPGISPVCVLANLALTLLASMFVALAGPRVAREPQFLLLLGVLLGSTWLSVSALRTQRSNLQ